MSRSDWIISFTFRSERHENISKNPYLDTLLNFLAEAREKLNSWHQSESNRTFYWIFQLSKTKTCISVLSLFDHMKICFQDIVFPSDIKLHILIIFFLVWRSLSGWKKACIKILRSYLKSALLRKKKLASTFKVILFEINPPSIYESHILIFFGISKVTFRASQNFKIRFGIIMKNSSRNTTFI